MSIDGCVRVNHCIAGGVHGAFNFICNVCVCVCFFFGGNKVRVLLSSMRSCKYDCCLRMEGVLIVMICTTWYLVLLA